MIDPAVIDVLRPIISVLILQVSRIEPQIGIMGKEERTAIIASERQGNTIERLAILHLPGAGVAGVIDIF